MQIRPPTAGAPCLRGLSYATCLSRGRVLGAAKTCLPLAAPHGLLTDRHAWPGNQMSDVPANESATKACQPLVGTPGSRNHFSGFSDFSGFSSTFQPSLT